MLLPGGRTQQGMNGRDEKEADPARAARISVSTESGGDGSRRGRRSRRGDWVIRPAAQSWSGGWRVGLGHFSVVIAAGGMVSRGAATPAWVQSVHARFFPGCAGVTAGKRVPYRWLMTQTIHSSSPWAHQLSL